MRDAVFLAGLVCVAGLANAAEPTDAQLRYVCRDFVKQQLHDPRGADLSGWIDGRSAKNADGTFTVQFPGRAAVGGGSLRLVTFECVVRPLGDDSFKAVSVRALPRPGL